MDTVEAEIGQEGVGPSNPGLTAPETRSGRLAREREIAPWQVLSTRGSSNVEVQCLELTDRSSCIEFHADPAIRCARSSPPYGDWASNGLDIEQARNVNFVDLNIHGLANNGVFGDSYRDLSFVDVRVNGNGFAGFNLDSSVSDGPDVGTILFDHVEIGWNGCGETYPQGEIHGCWAQSNGGYGDGVGTASFQGNWIIRDSFIHHNTSDGLDLLYALPGSTVTVERSRFERNAGNQLKSSGDLVVDSSSLVSECSVHDEFPHMLDPCRALGSALSVAHHAQYWSGHGIPITWNRNLIWATKGDCPAGNQCVDPLVVAASLETFNGDLTAASPARHYAEPANFVGADLRGVTASGTPDAGAYQYGGLFGDGFENGSTRRWSVRDW